jgi:hypothetical protein
MDASINQFMVAPQAPIRGSAHYGLSTQTSSGVKSFQLDAIFWHALCRFQTLAHVWLVKLEHPVYYADHLCRHGYEGYVLSPSMTDAFVELAKRAILFILAVQQMAMRCLDQNPAKAGRSGLGYRTMAFMVR